MTFFSYSLTAQTASIDTLDVCAAQEVVLPVYGTSILNVGALTLYFGFDTINLIYNSIENIDPQIQGFSINLMTNPTQIAFAWSNTTPANFTNNKLFDIKFVSNGNSAIVHFNSNCEISDSNGVVIPTTFVNGAVLSGLPQIFSNPSDTTVNEGGNAHFEIDALNATEFSWRVSDDNGVTWLTLDDNENYSGTKTNQLTIQNIPLAFNNNLYQCILNETSCQLISESAKLTVDEIIRVCELNDLFISIYPNPFNRFVKIKFFCPVKSELEFQITDECGQIIKRFPFRQYSAGNQYILFNTDNLINGVYYLRILSNGGTSFTGSSYVIVKN